MLHIVLFSLTALAVVQGDSLTTVRGVSLLEQGLYNPSKDFTCFDGSKTIPFNSVNDDYCDCVDGSDEPGTSACPEGKFYCRNLGHKAMLLQSSRVNDGICDCCDGSDEYDSPVACFNQCEQQGKEEQIRLQQEQQEHNAGFGVRKNYIHIGEEKKREKKARSDTLNQLLEERRSKLEELRTAKENAEAPEKEAKERHEKIWNDQQEKKKAEEEQIARTEAYGVLDLDKNGWVSFAELMAHPNLKEDMSENDAKDILGGEALVDADGFEKVWPTLKEKYLKDGRPKPVEETVDSNKEGEENKEEETDETPSEVTPAATTTETPIDETPEERIARLQLDEEDEDEEDDDDEELEFGHATKLTSTSTTTTTRSEDQMPEYDEVTKNLIEAAENARRAFDEADKEIRDLESEQKTINDYLNIDFGQENEFAALKGECFEFTDREYTYKLCPFDSVTQRQKTGGSETDLGRWGEWQNGYTSMKYTGGTSCWNGPARSALVRMSCGKENVLLSVVEPSRCEYEMEFKTPALCTNFGGEQAKHTEL